MQLELEDVTVLYSPALNGWITIMHPFRTDKNGDPEQIAIHSKDWQKVVDFVANAIAKEEAKQC